MEHSIKNVPVKIWDGGEELACRYTVGIYEDDTWYYFILNDRPFSPNHGISQFIGQYEDGYVPDPTWGVLIENLEEIPTCILRAIEERLD